MSDYNKIVLEQSRSYGANHKEWLAAICPLTDMDLETFKKRCSKYVDEVIIVGETNCEFVETDRAIEARFTNGACAMWSKAGHLQYRSDTRI